MFCSTYTVLVIELFGNKLDFSLDCRVIFNSTFFFYSKKNQ